MESLKSSSPSDSAVLSFLISQYLENDLIPLKLTREKKAKNKTKQQKPSMDFQTGI